MDLSQLVALSLAAGRKLASEAAQTAQPGAGQAQAAQPGA